MSHARGCWGPSTHAAAALCSPHCFSASAPRAPCPLPPPAVCAPVPAMGRWLTWLEEQGVPEAHVPRLLARFPMLLTYRCGAAGNWAGQGRLPACLQLHCMALHAPGVLQPHQPAPSRRWPGARSARPPAAAFSHTPAPAAWPSARAGWTSCGRSWGWGRRACCGWVAALELSALHASCAEPSTSRSASLAPARLAGH